MSVPSGCTANSPKEYSPRWAFFQYSSHPARSRTRPEAFTPANVGARCRSILAQPWSGTACPISRLCCSTPVALFHVGCLGVPEHPLRKRTQTTKDTKEHETEKFCNSGVANLFITKLAVRTSGKPKGHKGLSAFVPFVSFVLNRLW